MVRVFYKEMWDHAEKSLIPTIFHPGFTFRGSLGPSLVGYEEFAGYVDWVTGVFGQYTTDILALIEEGNRVSGKMRFHGFHRQEVFGVPPSGRHVWWTGMPIFTFDGTKVRDALAGLEFTGALVPGNKISFDATGKPKTSYLMTQNLPNNDVAIVWPSSIEGSKPAMLPMPGTS